MVAGALPGGSGDVPVNPFLSVPGPAAPAYLGAEGAGVGLAVGSMFFTGVEAGSTYGPPGAVIGGILGAIAGVLEDIFGGGGPSEPWWWTREDTHPGGSPSTWAPLYGMPAAYPPNQEPSAPSPAPSNQPPLQQPQYQSGVIPVQFYPYNYCGPGNNGGPTTPGTVDACCKAHDACYGRAGLSANNMATPGSSASAAQQACDNQLCKCVGKARVSGPIDFLMRFGIREYFGCH